MSLSKRQFSKLRHGDRIVIKSRSGQLRIRTILHGPADHVPPRTPANGGTSLAVQMPRRNRSQYNRAYVTTNFYDLAHRIVRVLPRRLRTVCSKAEAEHLEGIGFNPAREYRRELREEMALHRRRGTKCPFKPLPLP